MSHNIMIWSAIAYYKLYLLLLPYLVFWFNYITFLFTILINKIFKRYKVIYFPEENEWVLHNFLVILPKRIGFKLVYFLGIDKILSKNNLVSLLLAVLIILVIGIPIIALRILWVRFKVSNMWETWDKISPYMNIKIIIIEGSIIRNMKKGVSRLSQEVVSRGDARIEKGLITTQKGTHAVTYDSKGGVGVTFTSKEQVKEEKLKVFEESKSYGYAQIFGENKMIKYADIRNKNLTNILDKNGTISAINANRRVSCTGEHYIKINEGNKQKYIELKDIHRKKSLDFINYCGGVDKVDATLGYNIHYHSTIDEANYLILKLANADNKTKVMIFNSNKKTFENLKVIYEESGDTKAGNLISKIVDLVN